MLLSTIGSTFAFHCLIFNKRRCYSHHHITRSWTNKYLFGCLRWILILIGTPCLGQLIITNAGHYRDFQGRWKGQFGALYGHKKGVHDSGWAGFWGYCSIQSNSTQSMVFEKINPTESVGNKFGCQVFGPFYRD